MSYGLIFISWSLVIIMFLGMSMISFYRLQLKYDRNMRGIEKMMTSMIIEKYDNSNFIGRVSMVLHFGTLILSIICFPFAYKNKK